MENKNWHVIGLMSGTSLDGVDLVYVKIHRNKGYDFEILKTKSVHYSELWKKKLKDAFAFSGEKLTKIDADYGVFLGELVGDFMTEFDIKKVDFLASHGHTIFHDPSQNYTLQIGSGAHLAAKTHLKVICDFRTQDVALGGQGAPLVPIGDQLLFSDYDFCLNIGGFANVSFQNGSERAAYDICPTNIVLNHFTRLDGMEYDEGGKLAATGKVDQSLLIELNALSFYQLARPKSLGYEFVVEFVLPIIEKYSLSLEDVLCTFIEHIAMQISDEINKASKTLNTEKGRMLITGGGAFNKYMIQRIADLAQVEVVIPSREIIEFKEALIFAFLGVLKDQKEVNCLSSVTGAEHDHSSGVIYSINLSR